MKIIKYELGFIYPWGLRFLGVIFYLIIMFIFTLFESSILEYIENVLLSKLSLICIFINLCIVSYKKGIYIDVDDKKLFDWFSILGYKFGFWEPIPKFKYLYLSRKPKGARYGSFKTGSTSTISYSICYLYGVIDDEEEEILIFKDYFNKPCLDIAFLLREVEKNLPIKDFTGVEEVEY